MALPSFKYHSAPVATGNVVESDIECCCCGKARGYIYIGPVYAIEEYDECICPWCIANGSAHEKLDASFTDEDGIGGDRCSRTDWDFSVYYCRLSGSRAEDTASSLRSGNVARR